MSQRTFYYCIAIVFVAAGSLFLAQEVQAQTAPTAALGVGFSASNLTADISVTPGNTIVFVWSSTNGASVNSSYTISSPDTCPGSSSTSTGPFPWVANTLSGQTTATVQACQANRTYTITYTVTNSVGQSASAQVIVRVGGSSLTPTASLTTNLGKSITVAPGTSISYTWSSTNATLASSAYTIDAPDTCPGSTSTGTGPFNWVAFSTSGTYTSTVQPCQANRTYTITYQVWTAQFGNTATDQIVIRVTGGTSGGPTATLTTNLGKNITVAVGTPITYTWSSANAVSANSSYTISPSPDTCGGGSSASTGPLPWVANTLNGSVTASAQACQAGRTYTITYRVTNASGQTAQDQITIAVTSGAPGTPTASLTANNKTDLTVAPGTNINYVWSSTNGASANSSYTISPSPDTCGGGSSASTGPLPWVTGNTLAGNVSATVQTCQTNRTYTITYQVTSSNGQTAQAQVIVRVTTLTTPPPGPPPPPGIPPSSLRIENLTNAARNPGFLTGDRWKLTAKGPPRSKLFFKWWTPPGRPWFQPGFKVESDSWTAYGITDGLGIWTETGTFQTEIGSWEEQVKICPTLITCAFSNKIPIIISENPLGTVPITPQERLLGSIENFKSLTQTFNNFAQNSLQAPVITAAPTGIASGTWPAIITLTAPLPYAALTIPQQNGASSSEVFDASAFNAENAVCAQSIAGENRWWVTEAGNYVWSGDTMEKPEGCAQVQTGVSTTPEEIQAQYNLATNLLEQTENLAQGLTVLQEEILAAPEEIPTPVSEGGQPTTTLRISVTVFKLNIRSAPNSASADLGDYSLGQAFTATGAVCGERIDGEARWWINSDGNYVWSGGVTPRPSISCP